MDAGSFRCARHRPPRRSHILRLATCAVLIVATAACGGDSSPTTPVSPTPLSPVVEVHPPADAGPVDRDLSRLWVCLLGLTQPLKILPHLLTGEALRTRGRGVIMGLDYVGAPTPSFVHQLSEIFRVGHL